MIRGQSAGRARWTPRPGPRPVRPVARRHGIRWLAFHLPVESRQVELLHCGILAVSAAGFMSQLGHKPAYLSPRRAGGMSAMLAIGVGFCCTAAKEVQCHDPKGSA
jgi:hypothetical protein